ncbi:MULTISPECIES: SLC13 family permease [Mumia]|uniref:SLC13 family permease n=1 Tax=Mumia xiangluensis TaxID=1678900 RepID=A0ABW1QJA9_9ACTN|nr:MULTISPECIES: SLC13 family permease [Mumia]
MRVVRRVAAPAAALPAVAALAGTLVLVTGWLPYADAVELLRHTGPVLVFVVAITAYAELCAVCGLFDAAAGIAVRASAGRRLVLSAWVAALATLCTITLSLDTTAVLLTPVVLAMARRTGSDPLPLALTVVALANTASLLLPVSNLTNLLAAPAFERAGTSYVATMALPALAVLAATIVVLALLHRRGITGRFTVTASTRPEDLVLLRTAAVTTVGVVTGFVAGASYAWVAVAGTLVLGTAILVRRRSLVVPASDLVPWRMVVAVAGLFVVVGGAHAHGLDEVAASIAGSGTGLADLARLAAVGAGSANAINNLPAYLALAPVAVDDAARTAVLLVAVGAGPLLTPWGSLATLLWWRQVQRHGDDGARPTWRRTLGQGLVLAPVAVAVGTVTVALTSR